ncbi:neutral/alkaline non-lysosomal ceramidase N-terminal domain-containing protein [Prolixibacteraceae bacterium Z1-6]|uniref:Neutral/alkaline non-lysosomal ceramidase N-terminal domain-containing protein n=1 Tax=Draconibacterium aestuarii TaxID=2998507 RepID=A0A9X3F9V9_9BACT|nr:neutral/alkaline non-lysosomal ceramidase N-terminal domain-containing protein [Prolixibacteraceae bacterium Z1-6]
MRRVRKIGISISILMTVVVVIGFWATTPVDRTPYFKSDYYKNGCDQMEKLAQKYTEENDSLMAGFAKVSITPKLNSTENNNTTGEFTNLPLSGFSSRKGASATGIHDSIFVKAAALKINEKLIVFIGADLLIIPPNITDSIMVKLGEKGYKREQLFFSASHTHSSLGAWGQGWVGEQFAGEYNAKLVEWLTLQFAVVVQKAVADLKPAEIGTGDFNAKDYTRNRLIGELGTKNDDFSFIYLKQTNGKKAVIGSFSAHSTTMGDKNMEISGDYPGYWQRKMEKTTVDYALFFAGSVGSQTHRGEGEGFEKPKFIGEALADSLNTYLQKTELSPTVSLSSVSLKLQLPDYNIRLTTKTNLSTFLCQKINPVPDNAYLQVAKLGNMIWITTPSDFSGEYALQIKNNLAAKGFKANISSFNGSYLGYIIPGKYFYLDKYEPKTMGWFGPNMGDYTMDLIHQLTKIVVE